MSGSLWTKWILAGVVVSLAAQSASAAEWDRAAAARYLDARAEVWTTRARARQKLQTACISCHTAMPYLLSRGALDSSAPAAPERALFSDVESRVANWGELDVWYDETRGPEKPEQSWATESVLNALVLTQRDRRTGGPLTDEARAALDHMWTQQNDDGHWTWLHFGLGPWETDGSDYWAACLAAVAAMSSAEQSPAPADASARLKRYLRAGLSRDLSLHNRLSLLWAASHWRGLLSASERRVLVGEALVVQQPDGGFRLVDLGPWKSKDGTPPGDVSDGYATAYSTFVLGRLDSAETANAVERGVSWLERNQKSDGRWETLSPNKDRSAEEDFTRLLASDAATGFAVLALTSSERLESSVVEP